MRANLLVTLSLLVWFPLRCGANQDPIVDIWKIDGRAFAAVCLADREAREEMSVPGKPENAAYEVIDTGKTFIVTITQPDAPNRPRCVQIRIRKSDQKVIYRIRLDEDVTYEKFRAEQERRQNCKQGAEPVATDNPDRAQ